MGMYDYMGGEQIKIFYTPIFDGEGTMYKLLGESCTWHSGGRMRDFNHDDNLPLRTLYYKYPDNFIVCDYTYDDYVWVIKDGKFIKYIEYSLLKDSDFGEAVYDKHGTEINVNNIQDFENIKKDYDYYESEFDKLYEAAFPEDVNGTETNEEYSKKLKEVQKHSRQLFTNKWYGEDIYYLEKNFGELLDCFLNLHDRQNESDIGTYSPKKQYANCKKTLKAFIDNHEDILNKYITWYDGNDEEKEILQNIRISLDEE